MDYRKFGDTYYIRIDKGEEIISSLLEICEKENIRSAIYSGIGGCDLAEIQVFDPEAQHFNDNTYTGLLELIALNGNIFSDDSLYHHTHAIFAYDKNGEHHTAGGHVRSLRVLYTAEIELRPVKGGVIKRKYDEETGTGFWDF